MLRQNGSLHLQQLHTVMDNSGTRLNAREGVDFKLISIPHHCHKADIYLSSLFSTYDLRPWSQTPLEDESVSVLSVCKWSKVNRKAIIRN